MSGWGVVENLDHFFPANHGNDIKSLCGTVSTDPYQFMYNKHAEVVGNRCNNCIKLLPLWREYQNLDYDTFRRMSSKPNLMSPDNQQSMRKRRDKRRFELQDLFIALRWRDDETNKKRILDAL